jgi:hypothetical protein
VRRREDRNAEGAEFTQRAQRRQERLNATGARFGEDGEPGWGDRRGTTHGGGAKMLDGVNSGRGLGVCR